MHESINSLISDFERSANLKVIRLREQLADARREPTPAVASAPAGLSAMEGRTAEMHPVSYAPAYEAQFRLVKQDDISKIEGDLARWEEIHKWANDGYIYIDPFDPWYVSYQLEFGDMIGFAARYQRVYYRPKPGTFELAGDRYFYE